jgi:RimJ/RimL family protein N-acetyltransferase
VTKQQEPIGIFYTWWRGDELPAIAALAGLCIDTPGSITAELEQLLASYLARAEANRLLEQGDRLYTGRVAGDIQTFGWTATRRLSIGELGVERELPPGNQYLWGFLTVPEARGKGLYPHLLQAILRQENATRFWIGHDYDNYASARGILRAGFRPVGQVFSTGSGGLRLVPCGDVARARACEALFGVPIR